MHNNNSAIGNVPVIAGHSVEEIQMCQEELTYIFIYFYWRNPDQHINKQSYHSITEVVSPLISNIILQRNGI